MWVLTKNLKFGDKHQTPIFRKLNQEARETTPCIACWKSDELVTERSELICWSCWEFKREFDQPIPWQQTLFE